MKNIAAQELEQMCLVTTSEAAEIYGCTRSRIRKLATEKRLIPVVDPPRGKLYAKADIERVRDENKELRALLETHKRRASELRENIS